MYSRVMHVASLGNPNPSAFLDSLLVSRPYALSTPHAWVLCDLGSPTSGRFTDNGEFFGAHFSWPNLAVRTTDGQCHIDLTLLLRIDV